MGRQAHLTRLALGRSPYGDPVRDDNGDFIMSSRAGIYDTLGYKQDFDDRGHPRNTASDSASRRLRKAQNSVMAVVGVVVSKDEAQKSEWEKLRSKDKAERLVEENQKGKVLKGTHRALGVLVPWSICALRNRITCFPPYYETSIVTIIWNEIHSIGLGRFMTVGLPLHILAMAPKMYRYYVRNPDVEDTVNYVDISKYSPSRYETAIFGLIHLPCFALEIPLQVYSTLQSLLVIKPDTFLPISFFIPFTYASPICLPTVSKMQNWYNYLMYAAESVQTPFLVSLIREYLHSQLSYRIYALLRQVLVKPDQPDALSTRAFDELEELDDTSIPGLGRARTTQDITRLGRHYGPRCFLGAFRIAFPVFYKIVDFVSGGRFSSSPGRLSFQLESYLRAQMQFLYRSRIKSHGQRAAVGSIADVFLRREVMWSAFSHINIDPDEELVDPYAWADSVLDRISLSSTTSTPDPRDLFDFTDFVSSELQNLPEQTHESGGVVDNHPQRHMIGVEGAEAVPSSQDPDNTTSQEMNASLGVSVSGGNTVEDSLTTYNHEEAVAVSQETETTLTPYTHGGTTSVDNDTVLSDSAGETDNPISDGPISTSDNQDHGQPLPSSATAIRELQIESPSPHQSETQASSSNLPTPVQGISRAVSLMDPQSMSEQHHIHVPDPPGSTPSQSTQSMNDMGLPNGIHQTDTLESRPNGSFGGNTFSDAPWLRHIRSAREPRGYLQHRRMSPVRKKEYRVTLLSTFSADNLAWHASSLITSIVLWPLELIYLRSIMTWFLRKPALAGLVDQKGILGTMNGTSLGGGLRLIGTHDLFGTTNGAAGFSKMRYAGSVLLTFGLEALGRGLLWHFGTRTAMRQGNKLGWGRF